MTGSPGHRVQPPLDQPSPGVIAHAKRKKKLGLSDDSVIETLGGSPQGRPLTRGTTGKLKPRSLALEAHLSPDLTPDPLAQMTARIQSLEGELEAAQRALVDKGRLGQGWKEQVQALEAQVARLRSRLTFTSHERLEPDLDVGTLPAAGDDEAASRRKLNVLKKIQRTADAMIQAATVKGKFEYRR